MRHSHYKKDVSHLEFIDVYRVCQLFGVTDPAIEHAVKKLLCAGQRGAKSNEQDYREAIDSISRALQMIAEDCSVHPPLTTELAEDIYRAFMVPVHLMGKTGPVMPMPAPAKPARAEELQADADTHKAMSEYYERMYSQPVPRADNAELMDALRNTRHSNTALLHEVRSLNEMNARAAKILDDVVAGGSPRFVRPIKGFEETLKEIFKDCGIEPAKPADDGWIEWGGGECPVGKGAIVEYRMRDGSTHRRAAGSLAWVHDGFDSEIVGYRIAKEQA